MIQPELLVQFQTPKIQLDVQLFKTIIPPSWTTDQN